MPRKGKSFFDQIVRAEDELARQRDVEALIAPRRLVAQDLPLDRIRPNPFQARRTFDGIEELAQVIRAQGFTTRLRVRPDPTAPGYFQLAFGERRLRAAKEAGLQAVPCEVAEHTDDEMIEIGLAENIQRRDLDPLEEADAFQTMIEQRDYSVRRLAERIGKDKCYVENRLALLRVPDDVQEMVAQRPDTMRVAREIAKLATTIERQPLIDAVLAGTLNAQEISAMVRDMLPARENGGPTQRRPAPNVHRAMERDVQALRTVLERLGQLVPVLDPADRAALAEYLSELRAELDTMAGSLRS